MTEIAQASPGAESGSDGTTPGDVCPSCQQDPTWASALLAPSPTLIRCRRCNAKLRYVGVAPLLIFQSVASVIWLYVCYRIVSPEYWPPPRSDMNAMILWYVFPFLVPMCVHNAWYLRKFRKLASR
jgi:hypothetical protein